jgi:hypothetical protein
MHPLRHVREQVAVLVGGGAGSGHYPRGRPAPDPPGPAIDNQEMRLVRPAPDEIVRTVRQASLVLPPMLFVANNAF